MLQEELKNVKVQVDEFLREFFEEKKQGIGKIHPEVKKLIEDIEDVTLRGGDRFRPFMVWLGAQSQNPKTQKPQNPNCQKELLKLMASVELLQSFALIHDDIIDKAETRRGGKTIKPDEKAILAGDLCFTFADELLNGFPVAVKKEYDILREEVIIGEWMDVYYTMNNQKLKNEKNIHDLLMKIYRYKTVSYTILQPFMMGYVFSTGDKHKGLPLQRILINIGTSFQMKDDYLDLFGDARFGKKIGGDLKEGKLTIWHAKIMEADRHRGLSLQKYNKIFGNQTQTQKDVEYVKKLMIDTGIKKQIEEEMRDLANSAKKEIEKLEDVNLEAKNLLTEMADFVIDREY